MFAFAIWDAPRRRLLLARDRLGVKPLYWARLGDRLLFASEIKAILASGLRARATERGRAAGTAWHALRSRAPRRCSRASTSCCPATCSSSSGGTSRHSPLLGRSRRIGACRQTVTTSLIGRRSTEFRALLEESVRLRLMSDVPLGVFLSGGIDSSAIAALMARLIDRPLQTFSVAFEDRAFNELEYARRSRARSAPRRTRSSIDDRDFFGALPRLVWHEDEPIAHPSSVPLYFVSELARQHVTVVLTGEGSDELLAGYGKYPRVACELARRRRLRAAPSPRPASRVARRIVPIAPGALGALRAPVVPRVDRTPEAMFFDNFAAIRLADSGSAALARGCAPASRPEPPTVRRWRTSTRPATAARCSTGCSTPTSRPTSSSC